jgi:hypothetical protein
MKVQYCSDLHLEFEDNLKLLLENPIPVNGDILILAGDIVPFAKQELADTFFDLWSKQFERVFWVAGNHEFYGSDIHLIPLQRNETVRHNIHRINNEIVILEDVVFIFSTLWSKISLLNEQKIMRGMADFRYIRNGENKFLATDYNDRHASSILFIQEMLTRYRHKRTVVVTHHIPTFYSYPPKYRSFQCANIHTWSHPIDDKPAWLRSLQLLLLHFNFFKCFDDVTYFDVVEFVYVQSTFISFHNFFYIVFETFQTNQVHL